MRRFGCVLLLAAVAILPAAAVTNGVSVLQNQTIPYGGAWIPGNLGGHYWQSDTVNGVCRVDGVNVTSNCAKNALAAGQIVVGIGPGLNPITYVFVPDASAKSTNVVRYEFDPVKEVLGKPLTMVVTNVSSTNKLGGAVASGRPVAVALDSLGNLYVGFSKSGDIIKVPGAMITTLKTPAQSLVGTSSDGNGINALLFFGNDLYIAETGGAGLSKIPDPSGVTRPACTTAAVCSASSLSPQISFFPGALATDTVSIYVGDAPLTTPGSVLQYDPTVPVSATNPIPYSINVPAYKSAFDGVTRSQYVGIRGLGLAPNGDVYVSDDPTSNLALPVLPASQGHLWKVTFPATPLTIKTMIPASGPDAGNTSIVITGTGFNLSNNLMSALFGTIPAKSITCSRVTTCTIVSPAVVGGGVVSLIINSAGQVATAGSYSFIPPGGVGGTAPAITSIVPSNGLLLGGTRVVVKGTNLSAPLLATSVTFGLAGPGTVVAGSCTATQCTVVSPAFNAAAVVDIQIKVGGQLSTVGVADKFTYGNAVANLFAWGITAPKGGMTFVPGSLPSLPTDTIQGGHMWSSDHAQGLCRHDPLTARPAGFGTPASAGSPTLHAMNTLVCDDGSTGSTGQMVYDTRINPVGTVNFTNGLATTVPTHYMYVPDNAVRSVAVWRLTFDPATETLVGPPEQLAPLADVKTLKPNGMAIGPDGHLYITDLTEMNIRRLKNPNGDPRLQTLEIVAVTGDGRGANGTIAFAGLPGDMAQMSGLFGAPAYQNVLFISENRAASWFDITACPTLAGPCATTPIPLPSGAFISGVAADPIRHFVYASDSPGGANATIWRYDLNNPGTPAIPYLTGGRLPANNTPEAVVWISQTGVRPWNPLYIPGGTAGFSFAFGIWVDARNGDLYVTEDPSAGARGGFGSAWVAHLVQ